MGILYITATSSLSDDNQKRNWCLNCKSKIGNLVRVAISKNNNTNNKAYSYSSRSNVSVSYFNL